jgi:adenine-specific DNA-methyltransferase
MARIHELLAQLRTSAPALAADIEREVDALSERRAFGLNFERHTPEAVELPGRKVRVGDKVRVQPPRGESLALRNRILYRVVGLERHADRRVANIAALGSESDGSAAADVAQTVDIDDLVVVAEFRDPIYPGVVSTGKVERGGDKPYHSVINAENFHALQSLLFTHRGKVDAIYIDPPYNTGAKDWKYNNDYVESDDMYRHSKWLAFMERRLLVARELLNPDDSVLIVTIDEKEYLRLGLLLEQTFPEAVTQMVTSVINPMGSRRADEFSRVEEYVFISRFGAASVPDSTRTMLDRLDDRASDETVETEVRLTPLNRDGNGWERSARPNLFFPIFIDPTSRKIVEIGESLPLETPRNTVPERPGLFTAWPLKGDREARWQVGQATLRSLVTDGWVTVNALDERRGTATIRYLTSGGQAKVASGAFRVSARRADDSKIVVSSGAIEQRPRSVWVMPSHSARDHGTSLLSSFLPDRRFPFPKSLYAVEDTLRFFLGAKKSATVVDFFSGSGTTAHAVMRLNKQDGGRRTSISVTNNEVSADEQKRLRERGLRPGDPDWESWGICDYITKPRIRAAITGMTSEGAPVPGTYRFMDEFPMSEGLEENVEFFTLTYEAPMRVQSNREFARIAPFLWLRSGSRGRRIESLDSGWDVADAYGVLADLDQTDAFLEAIVAGAETRIAFIITDEDRLFQAVVRDLPPDVEPVRMYESYLRNFEIDAMRSVR